MKRLRPRCFKEIFEREVAEFGLEVDYARVERLRRLILCFNKFFHLWKNDIIIRTRISQYRCEIRNIGPDIWLPEIRTE